MEEANDEDYIYEEDVIEEILLDDNGDEVLANEIEDATLDEYDADDDDDIDIPDEKCIHVFKQHKGSVFAIDVKGEIAVSGGEDEVAYVWNLENGEVLFVCDGHKDSVTNCQINESSTMVATGDMSGVIQVWDIATKSKIWQYETGDLEWLHWHPVAQVLLAGTSDGQCWMWQIPKDNCKMFASHGITTTSGCFMPDGKSAAIGYEDGTLKIIDLKTADVKFNIKGKDAHKTGVSEVVINKVGDLISTASIDGTCKLISISTGKVSATYKCASNQTSNDDETEQKESVECVAFSPQLPLLATGCLNGLLHIWNYKTGLLRHTCKHEEGVTKLQWDPACCGGSVIYTGCLDGLCRAWDARNGQLLNTFTGHNHHIYDLRITNNGEKMISASADGTVRVFKIRNKDTDPLR